MIQKVRFRYRSKPHLEYRQHSRQRNVHFFSRVSLSRGVISTMSQKENYPIRTLQMIESKKRKTRTYLIRLPEDTVRQLPWRKGEQIAIKLERGGLFLESTGDVKEE